MNYSELFLFHGGNTGSIPVRDANFLSIFAGSASRTVQKRPLTDKIALEIVSTSYDEKTQTVSIAARLKNHSQERFSGPVKLRVLALDSDFAIARIVNEDNGISSAGAVWDFTSLIPDGELKPDESSQEKMLKFQLLDCAPFRPSSERRPKSKTELGQLRG